MTPDIRERAERLLLELQSYAMDGNAYEGDHLSSELALPLISQALLEAHNAGRDEMREEAAGWLEVRCMQAISSYNAIVNGGDQSTAATYHAEGYALAEAATAIRSIT